MDKIKKVVKFLRYEFLFALMIICVIVFAKYHLDTVRPKVEYEGSKYLMTDEVESRIHNLMDGRRTEINFCVWGAKVDNHYLITGVSTSNMLYGLRNEAQFLDNCEGSLGTIQNHVTGNCKLSKADKEAFEIMGYDLMLIYCDNFLEDIIYVYHTDSFEDNIAMMEG